jgi:hypothetical protein
MRDEKPFNGLDDVIHGIHTGTEWAAELRLSDLRALAAPTVEQLEGSELEAPEGAAPAGATAPERRDSDFEAWRLAAMARFGISAGDPLLAWIEALAAPLRSREAPSKTIGTDLTQYRPHAFIGGYVINPKAPNECELCGHESTHPVHRSAAGAQETMKKCYQAIEGGWRHEPGCDGGKKCGRNGAQESYRWQEHEAW